MSDRIGYLTATMDLVHPGQIEFLKTCKALLPVNAKLVVGLTTDELAVRQKRVPILSWTHRRAILIEFPFVDAVIPHYGEDKMKAWSHLHFTDLFCGEEYKGTAEYACMHDKVKVWYVPCPLNRLYSSSQLTEHMTIANVQKFKLITDGTAGSVFLYQDKPQAIIIKTVRITEREFQEAPATGNVYRLPIPNPRNWKRKGAAHGYPMLPGVNSYRELVVQDIIKPYPWCTTLKVEQAYVKPTTGSMISFNDEFTHIKQDKANPRCIYFIYQYHRGQTLREWIDENMEKPNFILQFRAILKRVYEICSKDLKELELVHGDIHPDNICVRVKRITNAPVIPDNQILDANATLEVSLIDWGWCLHGSFHMDPEERAYYNECLQSQWDWRHFLDSLEHAYDSFVWYRECEEV